jgi:hypothetical protein
MREPMRKSFAAPKLHVDHFRQLPLQIDAEGA